tara:strand:+ start:177 stop:515 length:339 start_codon:yes stop_codon:yes gene_type:complete
MRVVKKKRIFQPNKKKRLFLNHVANINLKNNELVTFVDNNHEYDVVKKAWGYYATPSINKRLVNNNFLTFLVKNRVTSDLFIFLVQKNKVKLFKDYIKKENIKIVLKLNGKL